MLIYFIVDNKVWLAKGLVEVQTVMVAFDSLREKMVACQLQPEAVTHTALLHAFATVPREDFVPDHLKAFAYLDKDLLLTCANGERKRYLLRPASLAKLLQLARIQRGDSVLIVGAGCGYSAALVSQLAQHVVALEEDEALLGKARALFTDVFENIVLEKGKLSQGYVAKAPYDVIVVEGRAEQLPSSLYAQLNEGGRLVGVVGLGDSSRAMCYTKKGEEIAALEAFDLSAPLLPSFVEKSACVFL